MGSQGSPEGKADVAQEQKENELKEGEVGEENSRKGEEGEVKDLHFGPPTNKKEVRIRI